MSAEDPWDVVVVGGGPAGLAAATWLGRYRRRTLVVDSRDYRNAAVDRAHGYLGMDPVDPAELRARAREDLARYATVTLREAAVTAVEGSADRFRVHLDDGTEVRARRLLLATGFRDDRPDIEGFADHYGAQAASCPACDGFEARGAAVVVLGWDLAASRLALTLLDWAASVTIVTEGQTFDGDDVEREMLDAHGVRVVEARPAALLGPRFALRGVKLDTGETLPCEQVFFTMRARARARLAEAVGCELTDAGCVVVDEHGASSVPGVYAAGDLVPGPHLVQVAAASGAVAGIGCALAFPDRPAAALSD